MKIDFVKCCQGFHAHTFIWYNEFLIKKVNSWSFSPAEHGEKMKKNESKTDHLSCGLLKISSLWMRWRFCGFFLQMFLFLSKCEKKIMKMSLLWQAVKFHVERFLFVMKTNWIMTTRDGYIHSNFNMFMFILMCLTLHSLVIFHAKETAPLDVLHEKVV